MKETLTVIFTGGGVLAFIIFTFKTIFSRIKEQGEKMECLVTEKECDERHKRIDEYLIDGKETMKKLVEVTSEMNTTVSVMAQKITGMEEQAKQRRKGNNTDG